MQTIAGLLVHKTNMKQQTFEEYLQDRHAVQYHGTDDDMPDDFDQWIAELDQNKVIEYAERWGKELKHAYAYDLFYETIAKIV